jgi:hypothetical protein
VSQEIKIPVSANVSPQGKRQVDDLANALGNVAAAAGGVGAATQAASRGLGDLLRRAREARTLLTRELGQSVSGADTVTFMRNFAGMQPRSPSLRGFRSEVDWFQGHPTLFRDQRRAAEHRRRVLTYGMQGTSFARTNPGVVEPPGEGGGGGGGGNGGGGDFNAGLKRSGGIAMGFGRSMLALAGIGSLMAMAGRATDLATEEATGADTLKRRMGDLGVEFVKLRDRTRAAGDGLGVTYVESQRLAQAYSREVGNLGKTDLENLGGNLHTQFGFARSYGIDPAASTQFFGQMARFGIGRDEREQRKLALMIGDAIARNGYGGKVEDLLRSVADYTATASRMTLTVANASGYANALTSLTSRGIPGLDPASAAALLGSADSSIRRGGAMGEASLNFSYAALRNSSPGMNPVQAIALMEGGLFGTTRGIFGGNSPLAKYMGRGIRLDDTTTLDKMIPLLRRSYGNGGYFLDAVKNHFGLSSHAQAAALADMSDKGLLGATSRVLGSAGIDPMRLNASGFQMIGQLANARGGDLQSVFQSIVGRRDITDGQRKSLMAAVSAVKGKSEDEIRRAMVTAVSSLNIAQEKTPGTETRDAITDLTDKLTSAGGPLLSVLNPIREAVVRMAETFVPGYMDLSGTRPVGTAPWAGSNRGIGKGNPATAAMEQKLMGALMGAGRSRLEAAAIVGAGIAESNLDPLASNKVKGGHRGIFQWDKTRWRAFEKWAAENGKDPDDPVAQALFADYELKTSERSAGEFLGKAKTSSQAAAAMVQFERPGGWKPWLKDFGLVEGWDSRLLNTQRLAAEHKAPAAAAGAAAAASQVSGEATVHIRDDRSGKTHTVSVPLKSSSGVPRPSGGGGGRVPLVGGHISYGPEMVGNR